MFAYKRTVQARPKLGRWTAGLDELLSANAAKPAREQLTLIRIFQELHGRGYDGGYDAVRQRTSSPARAGAFRVCQFGKAIDCRAASINVGLDCRARGRAAGTALALDGNPAAYRVRAERTGLCPLSNSSASRGDPFKPMPDLFRPISPFVP